VTEEGRPLASSSADHIIKQIGKYAARLLDCDKTLDEQVRAQMKERLLAISWHRLRHTWAESAAVSLFSKHGDGAWAILKEWGGWSSEEAMLRYIEHARRAISDQAARMYQSSFTKEGQS
jgi:integrase